MTGTLPYVILDPYIEADLQYLLANSGGGGSGSTYDIAMEYTGVPVASLNILVFNAVRPFTLVAGLAGSYFTAQAAPSATTVFTILQNTTTIGTITFAASATSGTASFTSGVTFATGDELIIQSPASANGLLTLAITFKGTTTTTGGASTIVVEQGGTSVVPTATTLNFTGTNVTVTNPGSGVANINITANPSITVGSTVVVGGTTGSLLYDTGGTVGETNAPTVSLTNATGLPLATGVTGLLPVANGGTGTATPSIVGGTNVTVSGSWPNQTISASGGGGGSSINVKQAGSTVVSGLTDLNFVQGAAVAASGTQANVTIPTNYFGSGAPSTGSTPSLDGTATGQWSGSATGTVTVTTTQVNDVVILLIGCEQNAALQTVSSVASAHLTFARRGGFNGQPGTGNYQSFEIWWAPATTVLTSEVVTITLSAATDDAAVVAFAVHGAANIASPWDTGALPVITTGNPAAAPTFTTNQAHDFIFAASFSQSPTYDTSAWTALANVGNGGGANFAYISSFYEVVSSTQTAVSASLTASNNGLKIRLVDAITGDVTTTYVTGDRYYDTSTTPYTEYVYASATWHQVGSSGGSSINVQQAGSTVVTGLTVLNFASGATVSASGTTANVTVSGGGSSYPPFSPPLASYFPNHVFGTGTATIANDSNLGLVITANGYTGDNSNVFYKSITASGDWQATAQVNLNARADGGLSALAGIYVGNSSGKWAYFGFVASNTNLYAYLLTTGFGGTGASGIANVSIYQPAYFYKVTYTSSTSTLNFYYSYDGTNFILLSSNTVSGLSLGGTPNCLGFGCVINNNASVGNASCRYWYDTA